MGHVLIADTPEASVSLKRILNGHELVFAQTMKVALAKLQDQAFDLLIVGLHFDDSQMFEFMRAAKASSKNADRPLVCFCARDTDMARIMHESLEVTTRALGAWMYISEHAYNVYQDPDAEIRRVIERCLTGELRQDIQQQRINIQKQRVDLQQLRLMLTAQEWSTEMQEYLGGLRSDLELLLLQVATLQSSADFERAKVTASRDLRDRVSDEVRKHENGMTITEQLQSVRETQQSAEEHDVTGKEQIKEKEGHTLANEKQDLETT